MQEKRDNSKEEKTEILDPKNDIVFQSLFNQSNPEITKAFVQALLEEKIHKLIINDTKDMFREYPEDKLGILDLELDINDNEKVDVEVQLVKQEGFIKRLIYYYSKLYEKQLHIGSTYEKAKRVVVIAIINFKLDILKELTDANTKWNLRCENHTEKILTKAMEFHIIELKKVRENYELNKNDKLLQWLMFLKNPNCKEVEEIMNTNTDIKDTVIQLRKMSKDEKLRKLAELRQKAIMDETSIYYTGISDGRAEGMINGKIEDVIAMIKKGIDNKTISEITGLNIEKIEKLRLENI